MSDNSQLKIFQAAGSLESNKLNHIPWEQLKNTAEIIGLNSNKKILDAGCGIGGIAKYYASNYGSKVTAVDRSCAVIEYAKKHNSFPLVSYMVGSFPEALSNFDTFDVILCLLWLSDVKKNRQGVINKFVSKLSKEGYFVVADWLMTRNKENKSVDELCKCCGKSSLLPIQNFRESLILAGLDVVQELDLSSDLKNHWTLVSENLIKAKKELYASVNKEIVDTHLRMIELVNRCINEEAICSPLLICKKRY